MWAVPKGTSDLSWHASTDLYEIVIHILILAVGVVTSEAASGRLARRRRVSFFLTDVSQLSESRYSVCLWPAAPCSANAFFCHSNMCINNSLVCNGVQNCVYPWDENHCKGNDPSPVEPQWRLFWSCGACVCHFLNGLMSIFLILYFFVLPLLSSLQRSDLRGSSIRSPRPTAPWSAFHPASFLFFLSSPSWSRWSSRGKR